MNKLNTKSWWLIAVLFTLNGANVSDASDAIAVGTAITNIKLDTLCYYMPMSHEKDTTIRHFQNKLQLINFLDSTGYFKIENNPNFNTKKMTHKPNFAKWTYFTFMGRCFEHTVDISYGKDTVTINVTSWNHFYKCKSEPCPSPAPLPYGAFVYFIPFTEKIIKPVLTSKYKEFYYDE